MKHLKRTTLIFSLFLTIIMLISCNNKTYKLTIDNNIEVNVNNKNKIKENELVTITITIPINKDIDYMLFNDEIIYLTRNAYSFIMDEDVVITVIYKNIDTGIYSLKLPYQITTNIEDLNNIKKDTLVTLNINIPPKRVFRVLRINNQTVETLTDNTHSFEITENTVVSVYFDFLDNYQTVPITEVLSVGYRLKDLNIISEGLLNIKGNFNNNNLEVDFLLDKDINVIKSKGQLNLNNKTINYYYDNENTYLKFENESKYYKGFFMPFKINNFLDLFYQTEQEITDELNLFVFADVVKIIFANLNNQDILNSIYFLKNDNNYKLLAFLSKDSLLSIKGLSQFNEVIEKLPEFYLELEVIMNDDKIIYSAINITGSNIETFNLNLIISYNTSEITPVEDLNAYEETFTVKSLITVYITEDIFLELTIDDILLNQLQNISNEDLYNYLNKFNITGLYTDINYQNLLKISDLIENKNLIIYVK